MARSITITNLFSLPSTLLTARLAYWGRWIGSPSQISVLPVAEKCPLVRRSRNVRQNCLTPVLMLGVLRQLNELRMSRKMPHLVQSQMITVNKCYSVLENNNPSNLSLWCFLSVKWQCEAYWTVDISPKRWESRSINNLLRKFCHWSPIVGWKNWQHKNMQMCCERRTNEVHHADILLFSHLVRLLPMEPVPAIFAPPVLPTDRCYW